MIQVLERREAGRDEAAREERKKRHLYCSWLFACVWLVCVLRRWLALSALNLALLITLFVRLLGRSSCISEFLWESCWSFWAGLTLILNSKVATEDREQSYHSPTETWVESRIEQKSETSLVLLDCIGSVGMVTLYSPQPVPCFHWASRLLSCFRHLWSEVGCLRWSKVKVKRRSLAITLRTGRSK